MLISAYCDDQAAPQAAVTATVDRPTPEPAAKVAVADDAEKAEMAVADDEERTCNSVATSKLDNHGCPPYPSGGEQGDAATGTHLTTGRNNYCYVQAQREPKQHGSRRQGGPRTGAGLSGFGREVCTARA